MVHGLTSKVAFITGGSRGIGFATAKAFLQNGAKVAVVSRNPEMLAEARAQLESLGEVEALALDIREPGQIESFVTRIRERFHRIDILVNNAGRAWGGQFIDQPLANIEEIIDVNVKGLLYTTHAVLPVMMEQRSGVIVNVSSGAGLHGFAGLAVYCTSKFAVVGFTESLSREVKSGGVCVFAICPGRVATDMQAEVSGQRVGIPPERVAQVILELAKQKSLRGSGRCLTIA
jgi:3-oxoacyl-[acyl-carrier protein] reductase